MKCVTPSFKPFSRVFSASANAYSQSTFKSLSAVVVASALLSACGGSSSAPADTLPPQLTLIGESSLTHAYGDPYQELGATALDAKDGVVEVVISGEVDINQVSSVVLTYTATDAAGNSASIQRTVMVTDSIAPVLSLTGDAMVEQTFGLPYSDLGVTAVDNADGELDVVVTGEVDVNVFNDYVLTYTATDLSGNSASINRTVTVQDKTAPIVSLVGDSSIVLGQGRDYIERGATAVDDADGQMTVTNIIGGDFDNTVLGTYQVTYQISDAAGNDSDIVTRSIEVVEPRPFIFTYQTSEANEVFTPSISPDEYAYNYSVDWGDGSLDENVTDTLAHTYAEAGIYTVSINGEFPQFTADDRQSDNYMSVEQWGDIKWQFVEGFFEDAYNLVGNATDTPDLRLVTSLALFFNSAEEFNGDVSLWQVGHIINFNSTFRYALAFNQDIGDWDVSSAEDFSSMFRLADVFNQDLSRWDVSSASDFYSMFRDMPLFDQDVSTWNLLNATDMKNMFNGTTLSSINYDKLLNSMAAQEMNDDVEFHGGYSQRTAASDAAVAALEAKGWVITVEAPLDVE